MKKDFLYVARDSDGELWLFLTRPVSGNKPKKFREFYWFSGESNNKGNALHLPRKWFPHLKNCEFMKVGIFVYLKDGVIGGSCLPGEVIEQ